ncbi:hypothetical protein ACHAXT_002965 [Thalassiosira profunda]
MRFREYNAAAPLDGPDGRQARAEYRLSAAPLPPSKKKRRRRKKKGEGNVDGTRDVAVGEARAQLVWSAVPPGQSVSGTSAKGIANEEAGSVLQSAQMELFRLASHLQQLGKDLFLPLGYPHSVGEGYLEYQFYDSLQGLCSYLRGVVSTSAVLSATGVGDAEATALSAAMTWALRDGLGMIGGLLFSYVASPHFDAYVKEFRLLADVLNDVGLTLDMALPLVLGWIPSSSSTSPVDSMLLGSWYASIASYLPSTYLVLTSTSTLCKVACGMAAGATKGNITDHFAISGNRADCQSKESTQETLVSLVGMCCGVWLAKALHRLEHATNDQMRDSCADGIADTCTNIDTNKPLLDAQVVSWSIFIFLTLVHVWANYVGMKVLRLRTLNQARAKASLQLLVNKCSSWVLKENKNGTVGSDLKQRNAIIEETSSSLKSPDAVSESLWNSMRGMFQPGNVHLGISLKDLAKRSSSSLCTQGQCDCRAYMIFVEDRRDANIASNVLIVLRVGATDCDELKAFLHAHVLEKCLKEGSVDLAELFSRSYKIVQRLFQVSSTSESPTLIASESSSHADTSLSSSFAPSLFTQPISHCGSDSLATQPTPEHGTVPTVSQPESAGPSVQSPLRSPVRRAPKAGVDLHELLRDKGWDMTRLYLGSGPWRCQWEDEHNA